MRTTEKGQTSFWIVAFVVIFGFSAFLLGTYFPNFLKEQQPALTISPSQPPPVVISQPVTPTESIQLTNTIIPLPTIPQKSDLELIKEAFAQKYNRPVSEINVTVSKNDGTHAHGGVSFAGEMGGGWFLAYKESNGWIIVQDGNGTISCEAIAPYNFPADMAPECVGKNGKLIKR
jgi:hypothetical protein